MKKISLGVVLIGFLALFAESAEAGLRTRIQVLNYFEGLQNQFPSGVVPIEGRSFALTWLVLKNDYCEPLDPESCLDSDYSIPNHAESFAHCVTGPIVAGSNTQDLPTKTNPNTTYMDSSFRECAGPCPYLGGDLGALYGITGYSSLASAKSFSSYETNEPVLALTEIHIQVTLEDLCEESPFASNKNTTLVVHVQTQRSERWISLDILGGQIDQARVYADDFIDLAPTGPGSWKVKMNPIVINPDEVPEPVTVSVFYSDDLDALNAAIQTSSIKPHGDFPDLPGYGPSRTSIHNAPDTNDHNAVWEGKDNDEMIRAFYQIAGKQANFTTETLKAPNDPNPPGVLCEAVPFNPQTPFRCSGTNLPRCCWGRFKLTCTDGTVCSLFMRVCQDENGNITQCEVNMLCTFPNRKSPIGYQGDCSLPSKVLWGDH